MSNRSKGATSTSLQIPTAPQWETRAKKPMRDGRWQGIDNSVWLWRSVPMSSVTDASSNDEMLGVGAPLASAYEELAKMAGRGANRRATRHSYRQTHALLVNIPMLYKAPPQSPIRGYLDRNYGDRVVMQRALLFGVKLRDSVGSGSLKDAISSVAETFQYGGAPLSDYDKDAEAVSSILERAGFHVPAIADMHLVDSWWNRGNAPGIPVIPHEEHMHYFATVAAAKRSMAVDPTDCTNWPEQDGEHAISFATVANLDLRYTDATTQLARWVTPLLDSGARVISIRALVEPSTVTRNELRGQQRRYQADLEELASQRKMDRAELLEREQELGQVEAAYAQGTAPATLIDTSILVGFDSVIDDISKLEPAGITLSTMVNRQAAAWHETMACSAVRANAYVHDLPASTIAYSALPSISRVGDDLGAFLGLTERDRQPAYFSPRAASEGDASPLTAVFGASGSGKLLTLDTRIPTPTGWTTMGELRVGDQVLGRDGKPCRVTFKSEVNEQPDLYRITLSDGQTIDADADHQWVAATFADRNGQNGGNHRLAVARWEAMQAAAMDLVTLADAWGGSDELTARELFDAVSRVEGLPWSNWSSMRAALDLVGAPSCAANDNTTYPTVSTIRLLASRIVASAGPRPRAAYLERVVTTAEMFAEGLTTPNGDEQWALRVPEPLQLPEAELPDDPYAFGARISDKLVERIPATYLRGSYAQRLAVLRGLMDTDGSVSTGGACELTLCNESLADDALELIRGLGIKARMTSGKAGYTRGGERVATGIRHRINFTTTLPVFRLPRKADRLPTRTRPTQEWLYIESIEKIDSRPGQCIQVDSDDSTYLAAGFVPTHNTQLLQFLADQFHRMGLPQLIVNPKPGDSLRDALEPTGAHVATLDSFVSSDGILDPIRIFDDPQMGISKAVSMIATVNPFGKNASQYMTAIAFGIDWGVKNGAKATGQALKMAVDNDVIPAEYASPVFQYAQVYPMFGGTFGMNPDSGVLRLSEGTTLVEVGQSSFELPNNSWSRDISEHPDPTVRNSMNIIRMLIWGGMSALRHRGGAAIHFDESWVMEMGAAGDLDQVGRLSRSFDVLPILYTQKPSLQRKIGLKGYLSRGLIGHIKDKDEVEAALDIFGQQGNEEMRRRISQPRYLSGGSGLNWDSLQHLPDPSGHGVSRGAVFYYVDMKSRAAPVEITLAEEFLRNSSTNPDDVRRRRAEREQETTVPPAAEPTSAPVPAGV